MSPGVRCLPKAGHNWRRSRRSFARTRGSSKGAATSAIREFTSVSQLTRPDPREWTSERDATNKWTLRMVSHAQPSGRVFAFQL